MNIWVLNYNDARNFVPTEPTMAIRIFDPGAASKPMLEAEYSDYPEQRWRNCPQAPFPVEDYVSAPGFTFEDLDLDQYPDDIRCRLIREGRNHLTANTADQIVKEFMRVGDRITALMVHCHAGASRSVAVANALDESFRLGATWRGHAGKCKLETPDYIGNQFVYRLVCEAAVRLM